MPDERSFDPQALTSLTVGRYDLPNEVQGFDPQALTSLTLEQHFILVSRGCFDPQALTSLTTYQYNGQTAQFQFRSTGSYEPDPWVDTICQTKCRGFDPQALTSLTNANAFSQTAVNVSIHRLLRA